MRPYRDFLYAQMPFLPYVYAAWFRVFGASIEAGRALSVVLSVVGTGFMMASCRRLAGDAAAVVAGLLMLASCYTCADLALIKTQALCHALASASIYAVVRTAENPEVLLPELVQVAGLSPVAIGLLRETRTEPDARGIKAMPLKLERPAGIVRAISSAGGVALEEVDTHFQLLKVPGVYCVGEMLDWEAPTGGYLLQACFSTAVMAARHLASSLKTS
jgi:hypothetical protein